MCNVQCIILCKVIRIMESGKFLLLDSGILGFGIPNSSQGICNSCWKILSGSKVYWQGIQSPVRYTVPRIQNPLHVWKSSFLYLESGIHNIESRIQDCLRLPYTVQSVS